MAAPPPPPAYDPAILVGSMISAVTDSLSHISFAAEGQFLLGALTLIALVLLGIKNMLAHETFADTVGGFVSLAFIWGLASWIIGTGYGKAEFIPGLISGFDMIATKILRGMSFTESLGGMLHSAVSLFEGDLKPTDASAWDTVVALPATLATLLFKIFSALFIVVAALLYAGQYLVTQFMIYVGAILAPILVPWIVFRPTQFLFEGWLKFMIVAGMQKIVGALLLMASAGIITKANALAETAGREPAPSFYIYAVVMLVLGIMAYLMMQATGIAHALMSGGMGIGQFKAPSKLTPGGAANAASGSMQKAGSAAMQGGAAAAGGLAGAASAGRAAAAAGASPLQAAGAAASGFGAGIKAAMSSGGVSTGSATSAAAAGKAAPGNKGATRNPIKAMKAGSAAGERSAGSPGGAPSASGSPTSLPANQQRASNAAKAALSTGRTSLSSSSGQWRAAGGSGSTSYRPSAGGARPAGVSAGYQRDFKAALRSQSKGNA